MALNEVQNVIDSPFFLSHCNDPKQSISRLIKYMENYSDGEDLSDSENLEISVDFLKFKSRFVLDELKDLIPYNLTDRQGRTLLHWAASSCQLSKAQFLLESDLLSVTQRDFSQQNALEVSARQGDPKLISYLQGQGLSCQIADSLQRLNFASDEQSEGQLLASIYADNPDCLQEQALKYVSNINGLISAAEYYEWTLAGVAGNFLSPRCLHWLLAQGADLRESPQGPVLGLIFESLLAVTPPETDEEYVQVDSGIDCLYMALDNSVCSQAKLSSFLRRGRLAGSPEDSFQSKVLGKLDKLLLFLVSY